MPCPHCAVTTTVEQPRRTALGQRTFRCSACRRLFNERTGTPFNQVQMPTAIVLLVVLWRRRYTLSLRVLTEMFMTRGCVFTHETVRDGEARCAPLLADHLRAKRRGTAGDKGHAEAPYLQVDGRWCYLDRAIARGGNLVEALLREKRAMDAARRFFARAMDLADRAPERVTTDGHDAYPRAIRETLGPTVQHRASRDKHNRLAQDHRGVKQRYYPMRGFGSFASAARCCPACEEQRHDCRAVARSGEAVSLGERRRVFQARWATIMAELAVA